jgi:meiotic recombination protein SPO11
MYYRDPALFSNQEVVNRYIDELAHTFNVSRSCLNVVSTSNPHENPSLMTKAATAKGLVVGAYWLKKASGSCVTGWSEKEVRSQQP